MTAGSTADAAHASGMTETTITHGDRLHEGWGDVITWLGEQGHIAAAHAAGLEFFGVAADEEPNSDLKDEIRATVERSLARVPDSDAVTLDKSLVRALLRQIPAPADAAGEQAAAQAAAELRYPETQWSQRATVLAFREVYITGRMDAAGVTQLAVPPQPAAAPAIQPRHPPAPRAIGALAESAQAGDIVRSRWSRSGAHWKIVDTYASDGQIGTPRIKANLVSVNSKRIDTRALRDLIIIELAP